MVNFNADHKAILDEMLLSHPHIHAGKMFGFPAYYVGKKLCICLYEQGVGVKLPEGSAVKLLETDQNVVPFQPLGKSRMREWIQINPHRSEDFRRYLPVFEESIQFLLSKSEERKS
jgi:hypothetical protein